MDKKKCDYSWFKLFLIIGIVVVAVLGIIDKCLSFEVQTTEPEQTKPPVSTPVHDVEPPIHVEEKETLKIGEWKTIYPSGAKSADGSEWHGFIKRGSLNKVIVYFLGGGVAIDDYTASKPYKDTSGFYIASSNQDYLKNMGLLADVIGNPFKDWTVLVIPYSTGDFHLGTKTYEYISEGEMQTIHHFGFINYKGFMNEASKYIDKPSELLITGYSAGGFASLLLAGHLISTYFESVENITVHSDCAFLTSADWRNIARQRWGAPIFVTKNIKGANIIEDAILALEEKYADIKIMLDFSRRDQTLCAYQKYLQEKKLSVGANDGEVFQENLEKMISELKEEFSNIGVYLWGTPNAEGFTSHTVLPSWLFYEASFGYPVTVAEWLKDAVGGDINDYGLEVP